MKISGAGAVPKQAGSETLGLGNGSCLNYDIVETPINPRICTVIRQLILINAPMIIAKYIEFTTNHPSLNISLDVGSDHCKTELKQKVNCLN